MCFTSQLLLDWEKWCLILGIKCVFKLRPMDHVGADGVSTSHVIPKSTLRIVQKIGYISHQNRQEYRVHFTNCF